MTKANECPQSDNQKPAARWSRVLRLMGSLLICVVAAQSVPAQCERMVGVWSWFINGEVTFKPDHTLVQGRLTGKWSCNPANGKVRIDWSHGFRDDLQLSADGQTLSGVNQLRNSIGGRRKSDLPGLQQEPLPGASASGFECPRQVGTWPLIPQFRSAVDGTIMRSGEILDGDVMPLRRACYYKSGEPQPMVGLAPSQLNIIHFKWVAPGQNASWSGCNRSPEAAFHYSKSRKAQASFLVQENSEREIFRNAGVAVFTNQIEPLGAPCDAPVEPIPARPATPDPVIFIPGFMGSVLRGTDGHLLWPPEGPGAARTWHLPSVRSDFIRLSLNPATRAEEIEATDALRFDGPTPFYGPLLKFLSGTGGYIEYEVNNNPDRRTTSGCANVAQNPKPSLFVFAYDWRLPIERNAGILADYVGCVKSFYPDRKVNIVTHSMGGLVARRYILDHPNSVNKLITVAAPFLGAPKPLYQMLYGFLSVDMNGMVLTALPRAGDATFAPVREMQEYYPGLHQLIASRAYYELGGPPYTVLDTTFAIERIAYRDLMGQDGIVEKMFPRPSNNGKTPARTNRDFHEYAKADGNGQDDWSRDLTGVKYHHLIGVQASVDTALSLREGQEPEGASALSQAPAAARGANPLYAMFPKGPGDGTVPLLSAVRIGAGRNLNAPNARLFIYAGRDALAGQTEIATNRAVSVFPEADDLLLEHSAIAANPRVMSKVLELLREEDAGLTMTNSERIEGNRLPNTSVAVRYQGKTYQTTHQRETDNGIPIDIYFYPITRTDGTQATQNGEKIWGRFVRKPAADSPNATSVEWWHATWVQRGGAWEQVNTKGAQFEVLGKLP